MKKELSTVLDMSRWLAAFFVTISHIRHIVLVDYAEVLHKNLLIKLLYTVTGFGHEAVMIFFVLSGFLVGGTTLRKWKTVDIADYFIHRFSRIYTVLIPALLAGYALDYMGSTYFNSSGLYTNATQYTTNSLKASISSDLSFIILLKNIFMTGVHLGSNGPLWSLVYEWWYYCIFAACLGLALHKNIYIKIASALSITALAVYCPLGLWVWMLIWWLGVAVFFYCESDLPVIPAWISAPLFIASLALSRVNTHNVAVSGTPDISASFMNDLAVSLGFSLLLVSLRGNSGRLLLSLGELNRKMANFSYSLYLSQFPLLIFIVVVLHDTVGIPFLGQPDALHAVYCLSVLMGLYMYGYLFYLCTERHTGKVRAVISRLLGHKAVHPRSPSGLNTRQDIAPQTASAINDSPHTPSA